MANTTVKGKFNVVAENGDVQTIYPKTTGDQVLVDRSSNASVIPNDVANLQHIVNKMGSLAFKSKVETSDFTTGTMINSLEGLKSNTETGKIADATVVKDIESRVDTLENSNLVTVDELDAGLATKPDTEINDSVTSTSLTWSSKKLSDQLTTLNSNTQLIKSRIDGLSTLQEGSTTGDAELIGIRTGYDGTNYSSAGEAIRGQVSTLSDRIDNVLNYDRIENDKLISYYGKNIPEGSIIRFKPISASTEGTEITGLAICGMYDESGSNGYDTLGSLRFDSDKAYIEIITSRYYHHLQIAKSFEDGIYNGTTAYCTYDILIIPNDNRLSLYKENIKLTNRINNLYNVPHNSMVTSIDGMLIYLTKDGIKINWSTTALVLLFTGTTYFFPTRENSDYAEVDEINFDFNTANATYALVYNTKLYEFSIKKLEAYNIKLDMYDIILCYACISTNSIISYYTAITNHFFINNIENVSLKTPYLYSGKNNTHNTVKDWRVTTGEKYKIQIWNIENPLSLNSSSILMFYFKQENKTDYVQISDRVFYYNYIEYNITVTEEMKWLRLYSNTTNKFEWGITKIFDEFNSDDLNTGLIKSIITDSTRNLSFGNSSCNIFKKVVCCGDSYTAGYISGVSDIATMGTNEDYAWPHYMELLTGNTWINCGHSGASSITWLTWDRGLPKAQTAGKTQAYILGLQLNDVSTSSRAVDLGTIEDIGADTNTTRTYYAGISRIIRELNTISPKAKIFVNTCPRTGDKYDTYNQALRDIVNEYKNTYPVHLIDLVNYKKYYDQISGDSVGSHYTAIGYERFAEIYKYVLSEYINTHITDFQDVHTIEYD